jgi:hypothetical protein
MRTKYPRTFHLPWSESRTSDDKTLSENQVDDMFIGREVVVTEKLDGENTTIYGDGYTHARSLDSSHHPSRSASKALAATTAPNIPEGWRLMGENLYAEHSISYDKLSSFFVLFGIADENNNALSWREVEEYGEMLGLTVAPVIYKGIWDEEAIQGLWPFSSAYGAEAEGYVVRTASGFPMSQFSDYVAKFVRSNHVQTKDHWMHSTIKANQIADEE